MDSRTQYYRSDVYGEHGLKPAVTWDDLAEVSRKLTGNGYYGLVVPGQGDPAQRTFTDFLWQAGGDWVDENNKPSFNAAPGIEALTFYRDLIQKWKVVPPDAVSYQWNENSNQFASGAVMDTIDWPGASTTALPPPGAVVRLCSNSSNDARHPGESVPGFRHGQVRDEYRSHGISPPQQASHRPDGQYVILHSGEPFVGGCHAVCIY